MVKRQPLSQAEKEYLYRRKQAGATHAEVARELSCAPETVRKKWQAFRRGQRLRPRGRPTRGILSSYPPEIRQQAVQLKQAHPFWGPANVLLELRAVLGVEGPPLPSPSRLSALFKAACPAAVQPRQPRVAPPPAIAAPRQVHQRWQIDAKEKIHLGDGQFASVLEIRDPVAAVILASQAFVTTLTPTTHRKLTLDEVRTTLRQAFSQWGRPAEIQTDHEDVYAGAPQADFPMPFTLWLVGLGIVHQFSRDACPTDQPHIERNHRTTADMSWKNHPPAHLADLQQQLDACRQRYNQDFPAHASDCQGLPPLVKHPNARHSGRPYQVAWEGELFHLEWVDHYLARFTWVRKVDRNGIVFLGNRRYSVGRQHKQQAVSIRFLPEARTFRFETQTGEWIQSLPAKGLEKSDLTGWIPEAVRPKLAFQLPLPLRGV